MTCNKGETGAGERCRWVERREKEGQRINVKGLSTKKERNDIQINLDCGKEERQRQIEKGMSYVGW